MRKLTKDDVTFSVIIESEDLPVRGNYMVSGDDEQDKEDENEILARLERGDYGAWCVIKVTAKWEQFEGIATLGGVSYGENENYYQKRAEEDAKDHGMYSDALENLNAEIEAHIKSAKDIEIKLAD